MSDLYQQLSNSPIGKKVVGLLGLPAPTPLRRFEPGAPLSTARCCSAAPTAAVCASGAVRPRGRGRRGDRRLAFLDGRQAAGRARPRRHRDHRPAELEELYAFFHEPIRRMGSSSRLLVLGTPPEDAAAPEEATAQRALEGFVRSVGKELRSGGTAQLVYVAPGAEHVVGGPMRFLLSGRSAFVSGQVVRVAEPVGSPADVDDPSARSSTRSPWSPAPRGASAPPSPRCSPAPARTSSASTCPPRARR
jgi:3-oxoacyl-[acyl-carrier protein] reductase